MDSIWVKAKDRISANLFYIAVLAVIVIGALLLRLLGPWDYVFGGEQVRFLSTDPWLHLRLIENTLHHLPIRISFDPVALFPHGWNVGVAPFFDVLLAVIIWVIGVGSPTQHTIDTIAAVFPPILGALTVIPVYMIGKEVFNRNIGLIAAFLIAIMPGEFLGRSLLGSTDHHVAEVFFSTLTILFLILALKSARQSELSFEHVLNRDWNAIRKPLAYTLLVGLMLGVYLLTWIGGLLLVSLLFAYLILQFLIDHLRGEKTDYLSIIGAPSFLIALILVVPSLSHFNETLRTYLVVSLVAGVLVFLVLGGASKLLNYRGINRLYYPLGLAGIVLVALLGLRFIDPSLSRSMWHTIFSIFHPAGANETTQEARSIFLLDSTFSTNIFSWRHVWYNFGTTFFITIGSLVPLTYAAIKQWRPEKILLVVWSVVMIAATIGQIRFSYYLSVNAAILTAYFSLRFVEWARRVGFRKLPSQLKIEKRDADISQQSPSGRLTKKERKRARREERQRKRERRPSGLEKFLRTNVPARYVLGVIIVIWLVLYPCFTMEAEGGLGGIKWPNLDGNWSPSESLLGRAVELSTLDPATSGSIDDDWYAALTWLRDNTPAPYPDEFYYELYEKPPAGQYYQYPASAYGVISWWDYGHWITVISRRIPDSHPGYKPANVAQFFVAQNETEAAKVLDGMETPQGQGTKYVIIDYQMATGKFYAMTLFAGKDPADYHDTYFYRASEGGQERLTSITLFSPLYYRSMCARLFNFGGKAVEPSQTLAVAYAEHTDSSGFSYKEITDVQTFTTDNLTTAYDNATAFIASHPGYIIVGTDPLTSPVRLEALDLYEPVYKSPTTFAQRGNETTSLVEIFSYKPD